MPLFVLTYTLLKIRQQLKHQAKTFMKNMVEPNRHEDRESSNRKRKALLTLSTVLAAYFICWTPSWIIRFGIVQVGDDLVYVVCPIGLLAFLSTFLNCLLYAFWSTEFRKQFSVTFPNVVRLLGCFKLKGKRIKQRISRTPLMKSDAHTKPSACYNTINNDF